MLCYLFLQLPDPDNSPFMVAANGKDVRLQDGQQQQPQQQQQQQQQQQLPGSPRKLHKVVQLNSEAREEELADLQRRMNANK